jgi:hypothetical protein
MSLKDFINKVNDERYKGISKEGRKVAESMSEAEVEALASPSIYNMLSQLVKVYEQGKVRFKFGALDKHTNEESLYRVSITKEVLRKGK